MKVLITAVDSKFIHSNLAVRYLKNFTKDLDYEGKIKELTINDREERILEEIIKEKNIPIESSLYKDMYKLKESLSKIKDKIIEFTEIDRN